MDQATTQTNETPTPPPDAVTTAGGVAQTDTASRGTPMLPAHRPGWQTTEFWVSVLTIIAIISGSLVGLPPQYAAIAASIAASCYSISRAITKLGAVLF